jgi:acyl-CoA synthetase (AMP-forming)/AMP-acid ligase II
VLGILRAGMVAVPMAPKATPAALASMIEDSEPSLVFADRANLERIPAGVPAIDMAQVGDAESSSAMREQPDGHAATAASDATALVLFTSGSTGLPKGVLLTHAGMLWALRIRLEAGSITASDRAMVAAPLAHMNGLVNTLLAYYAGASCLLLRRFDAKQYMRAIARYGPTSLGAVPTMMAMIAREFDTMSPRPDWSAVRAVMLGSAPCTEKLYDTVRAMFPRARVALGYGATETGPLVFGPGTAALPTPRMSVGRPLPSVETMLEGGDDTGELLVRSPSVSPGYLKRPEATSAKFVGGWYRTGDLMRRDADGFHFFCGRADDMFTCGGENVYPQEVEGVLEQHPAVQQAVVVPAEDEVKGQVPIAFVVLRPASQASAAELKQFALQRGLTYQHPREVVVLAEMPLSSVGKVDRASLAARARQGRAAAFSDASNPPRGKAPRT